ncbi:MAG: hypothetical protein KBD24_02380, partial [Candidatus Pacebacteria bacterium]|nr:hypothetical protein [Candidatus Paceibacterota bacterium]
RCYREVVSVEELLEELYLGVRGTDLEWGGEGGGECGRHATKSDQKDAKKRVETMATPHTKYPHNTPPPSFRSSKRVGISRPWVQY